MKIKAYHIIVPVLIAMCLTGCSEKKEYTDVIPVDAQTVVAIDVESLMKKSGEKKEKYGTILEMLKSGLSAESLAHLEKILKEPSESGISVKDRIYLFVSEDLGYPAVVAKIADTGKLKTTLQLLEKEGVASPLTKEKGFNYSVVGGQALFAFNDAALIIANDYDSDMKEIGHLLRYEFKENIHQNKDFQKMADKKGDIQLYFTQAAVQRNLSGLTPSGYGEGFYFVAGVDFEKGKIRAQYELGTENEEMKKLMKEGQKTVGSIDGDFLPYFPISTPLFYTANLNGKEYYDLLFANRNPLFEKILSIPEEAADLFKELMYSVKGDISVAITGFTLGSSVPTFVVYAKSDYKDIENLSSVIGYDIFAGRKDDYIYFTNDKGVSRNPGKVEGQSLEQARYRSHIKGKKQYAVVDINAIAQMPIVQMALAFGGKKWMADALSCFSYLEVTWESGNDVEMNLVLSDEETNSFMQLTDLVKKYSGLGY